MNRPESPCEYLPEWARLPGTKCIQEWAADLRLALTEKRDSATWELLGHGAIIEHPDPKRVRNMFQRAADDAGMSFVVVATDDVIDLPLGAADTLCVTAPAMVFLEPGDWMKSADALERDGAVLAAIRQFQKRLIQRLQECDRDAPVFFVSTTDEIDEMADTLCAPGAFDRRFAVQEPSMSFLGEEYAHRLGPEICGDSITASFAKLGKLISFYGDGGVMDLGVSAMKRLAKRAQRKVEFTDLVDCFIRGAAESDESPLDIPAVRTQVAYHEAGHALVAVKDSSGRNVPEYSTILEGKGFKGAVVDSYAYRCSLDAMRTYRDIVHQIRILLAGRAAEQLYAGAQHISTASKSDLERATRSATKSFALYGFALDMTDEESVSSNLAVVIGTPSASEYAHVESLTRRFLAREYQSVLELLTANRPLLDAIASRLVRDSVIDQTELAKLVDAHG